MKSGKIQWLIEIQEIEKLRVVSLKKKKKLINNVDRLSPQMTQEKKEGKVVERENLNN